MIFDKRYLEEIGIDFAEFLMTVSKNAAIIVLVVENIIKNNFDRIIILDSFSKIKDVMLATNFTDLLPPEYLNGIEPELASERFNELEQGFFKYYIKNLPIIWGYKIYPKGVALSKLEIKSLQKSCSIQFAIKKYSQDDDKKEFFRETLYDFYKTIEFLNGITKPWVSKKKRGNEILKRINDSNWLVWDGTDAIWEKYLGYSWEDEEETLEASEGNLIYISSLILKENYKILFWDFVISSSTFDTLRTRYSSDFAPIVFKKEEGENS